MRWLVTEDVDDNDDEDDDPPFEISFMDANFCMLIAD